MMREVVNANREWGILKVKDGVEDTPEWLGEGERDTRSGE